MAKSVFVDGNNIKMSLLQQTFVAALSDLALMDTGVEKYEDMMLQSTVYKFRAYVLADHLEHQEVEYYELPRWLHWLKRFTKLTKKRLVLDAYHVYPEAKIPLPDIGKARKQITYEHFNLPQEDE